MLEFVREGHFYLLDGVRIPSVTRVTDALSSYAGVPLDVLQRKAEIGDAVHFATELDDANDLDDASLPDEIRGFVEGWRKFKRETGWVTEVSEFRVYSKTYKYAGTLDRIGRFNRVKDVRPRERCLLDIKTTFDILPSCGPQTAGYAQAWNEHVPRSERVTRRFIAQLKYDGTYRREEFAEPSDLSVFLSVMTVEAFKKRHNLEKAA